MSLTTVADWLQRQTRSHPQSIDLGLTRVRAVAERLGLLPWRIPSVVVGGTNGKGSTVAALAAFARAAGLGCGVFTSPHLRRYHERIALDTGPIDDTRLLTAFAAIEGARGAISLTFFEWNTLAALHAFREAAVDLAVLEVGLGGRLDASNIVDADVAVLTSVELDHMEWLGPTREHIGREKAGIFRAQRPAVLATPVLPASVFSEADRIGAVLRIAGRDFSVRQGAETWDFHGRAYSLADLPLPALAGERQIHNAAAALAALERLALNPRRLAAWPTHAAASRALAKLTLPGRLQRVAGTPEWLLDVAHNPAAAAVVAAHLKCHQPRGRQWAVLGMLADKDAAGVVGELADVVDGWWLCSLTDSERGRTAAHLASQLPPRARVLGECATVAEACARARSAAAPDDRILVCGSFSTVGPALDYLGV